MIRDVVTTNVYGMKVKQWANGNFEWKLDQADNEDTRVFNDNKFYWIPIPMMKCKKGQGLVQNPGY